MFHQVSFICFTVVERDPKHLGFLLIFVSICRQGGTGFWHFLLLSGFGCSPWSWREAQKAVGYLTAGLRTQVKGVMSMGVVVSRMGLP